jgi:hypothetical protein
VRKKRFDSFCFLDSRVGFVLSGGCSMSCVLCCIVCVFL